MAVYVEVLREVTDETVKAFGRLLPQLSRSAPPLDHTALARVVGTSSNTVLVARAEAAAGGPGEIIGTLTLAVFPIPTGVRAWIEDVVVDEAASRQGAGTALTQEALRIARGQGARTVDLTSRPSREAAGRLYERLGFERRESRLYRFTLDTADSPAAGSPVTGSPAAGSPAPGSAAAGSAAAGSTIADSPVTGSPAAGSPAAGSPIAGSPTAGSPAAAG